MHLTRLVPVTKSIAGTAANQFLDIPISAMAISYQELK